MKDKQPESLPVSEITMPDGGIIVGRITVARRDYIEVYRPAFVQPVEGGPSRLVAHDKNGFEATGKIHMPVNVWVQEIKKESPRYKAYLSTVSGLHLPAVH